VEAVQIGTVVFRHVLALTKMQGADDVNAGIKKSWQLAVTRLDQEEDQYLSAMNDADIFGEGVE
jgi:hypothetical protein